MPFADLDAQILDDTPTADLLDNEDSSKFGDVNTEMLDEPKRSAKAIKYEKQAQSLARAAFALTVKHEATQPDAAALVMHAPDMCEKLGDVAAIDKRVAKGLDFLTGDVIENPYISLLTATLPFALQVIRNHEPQLEVKPRGIKLPFIKHRFSFKFGVKLGNLRMVTKNPDKLKSHVFDSPDVLEKLEKLGIHVDPDTD